MNILKLIAQQGKTTKKAVANRETVVKGVIENIDSAHAIARVLHAKAHMPWTKSEEKEAFAALQAAIKSRGTKYQLLNADGQLSVLREAAQKVHRSPAAVRLRLTAAGLYPGKRIK